MADVAVTPAQVEQVLAEIRPALQLDGGDVIFVSLEGKNARVRFTGEYTHCPSANTMLRMGLERRLREAIPGFGQVLADDSGSA